MVQGRIDYRLASTVITCAEILSMITALIILLSMFGINVSALILPAGVAVAFASKDLVHNFLAGTPLPSRMTNPLSRAYFERHLTINPFRAGAGVPFRSSSVPGCAILLLLLFFPDPWSVPPSPPLSISCRSLLFFHPIVKSAAPAPLSSSLGSTIPLPPKRQ